MLPLGVGPIHVTRPASRPTSHRGLVLHRASLAPADLRRLGVRGDRDRDGTQLVAGYRTLRFTWRQLTAERERVAALLGAALAPAHAPG
jgi:hypothetical protein